MSEVSEGTLLEGVEAEINLQAPTETPEPSSVSMFSKKIEFPSWLKIKTGEGSIEQYIDSPLNFERSRGLAQILRGITGLLGNLDFAIVDVLVGAFNYLKEKKAIAGAKMATGAEVVASG